MTPPPAERPWPRPRGEGDGERGSVLMLFPAAVLIVIVLAAITVDSAIAFLGQREVANAVAAAANDAAGEGVGNQAFYRGGRVDLDPATVRRVALDGVRAALDPGRFHDLAVDVTVSPAGGGCPPEVRVQASAQVDELFAAALPGAHGRTRVQAVAVASPRQDAGPGC